nr:MAG TPA: hypothetical protein [Caudoviricetes sp.]
MIKNSKINRFRLFFLLPLFTVLFSHIPKEAELSGATQ